MPRFTTWLAGGAGLLGAFVGLCACYSPSFVRCSVRCSATSGCPSGLECSSDNFCLPAGETCAGNPDDGGPGPDAGVPGRFRAVSAGGLHSCAIDTQGALFCWGDNRQGQLGSGVVGGTGSATRVGSASDWELVDAGGFHTCGIRAGGALYCWGTNGDGQLGDGTQSNARSTPIEVATPGSGTRWTAVAAGTLFTCGLRDDRSLWCWGANVEGQLAQPERVDNVPMPIQIGTDADWIAVDAGAYHVCGIRADAGGDGDLYCWGWHGDGDGRLGVGPGTISLHTPTSTAETAADVDWATLDLGESWGCALDGAGALYCWGSGGAMPGVNFEQTSVPTRYSTITGYDAVAAGGSASCVLSDGALECWGFNSLGELARAPGDGSAIPIAIASLADVEAVTAGYQHSCALVAGGEVRCWGANGFGQLGDGTIATKLTPVEVGAPLAPWRNVDVGVDHTCAVTDTAGDAYCWGWNRTEQIGNAQAEAIAYTPARVDFASTWQRVRAGGSHSCGLDAAGAVWCWGANFVNQLGVIGAQGPTPVKAADGPFSALEIGVDHTCALDAAGARVCWGINERHELGDGSNTSPVAVPTTIAGGASTWSALGLGVYFGCGVAAGADAGKLYCWGENDQGQLARPAGATAPAPVEVMSSAAGWTTVAGGLGHACGLRGPLPGHDLLCWGRNEVLQVGTTGDAIDVPFQLPNDDWRDVDLGGLHSCAVRENGDLHCWGGNEDGQLGDGTGLGRAGLGASVGGFHDWVEVSAGGGRSCAIRGRERRLYCWGENSHAAIGDGTGLRYQPVAVVLAAL